MWETADILKISKLIKVMGESEKCAFYFMGKKTYGLFGQPDIYFKFLASKSSLNLRYTIK